MIDQLDIESDFYADSTRKLLFKSEFDKGVPSKHMWAIVLLVHPKSKFSDFEQDTSKAIIYKDYLLADSKFNWDNYVDVLAKVIEILPTSAQRFIATWKKKLSEINSFLNSQEYNEKTYEMLTKIMKDFHPMMKQYREIEKEYQKELETTSRGDIELSLTEKGMI